MLATIFREKKQQLQKTNKKTTKKQQFANSLSRLI